MNGELEAQIDGLSEWNLDQLAVNWEKRYPKVIESWRKNWPRLSNHFQSNFCTSGYTHQGHQKKYDLPMSAEIKTDRVYVKQPFPPAIAKSLLCVAFLFI
ncbi:hypothetical protein ACWATR_38665 [Nostoc sp. UIC 10890]